ncbi:MAG: DUF4255 domain-containing protein [Crocinitomicaceae bacterium]|nr:DUF4255 domain-containing protein [Crocinitomicaceae bacterium]
MIDKVISTISKELATYLDVAAGLDGDGASKIMVSHLFNASGEPIPTDIGITLVNIEEDRVNRPNDPYIKTVDGFTKVNPEIKLNIYLLFSANFTGLYDEALKFISHVIQFFQSKSVFTTANTPDLDPSIEKLIAELHPMSFEQQNYLWGMVGGKYLPSAMYRFRMIVVQEGLSVEAVEKIKTVQETINK